MLDHDLSAPWRVYSDLQKSDAGRRIDPFGFGHDEALTELSELFKPTGRGDDFPDPDRIRRWFDTLRANRATKFRGRAALDRKFTGRAASRPSPAMVDILAVEELAGMVRRETSESEWDLLHQLADGYTYGEIAGRRGVSIATLKSRVSRIRRRVRISPSGRAIEAALVAG